MPLNPRILLLLTFTEGAAVMVAELAGAKMLAPVYGSSLYVWGSIIGITLISLTAGYYLGGWLSYLGSRRRLILWFLLAAAVLIVLMPALAQRLIPVVEGVGTVQAIILLTAACLFAPLVLLGAIPPLIISILADRVDNAGKAAGTVYGVSTLGGILATFVTGFYLIPEFGLTVTAIAGGIGLAVLPLLLLLRQGHFAALAAPAMIAAILLTRSIAHDHPDVDVLYESEGLLGQLKVMDIAFPDPATGRSHVDRILFVNRTAQTWVRRDTGEPAWAYVHYLQSVASLLPEGSRVLLLGLGGGTVAEYLQAIGHTVDSVELDRRIARIAEDWFGLDHSGDVIVDDGRHFLRSTDRTWDLIIFDVFQAEVPPVHMLTVEAFGELHQRLNPQGFAVVNYSGYITGSTGIGARSIYRTLLAAGFEVDAIPTGTSEATGNNLFVARVDELDYNNPRTPLIVNGRHRPLPGLFMDPAMIDLEAALVLTDNRPILEKLNLEASALWREGYYEQFTRPMLEKGIPIFQ